MNTQNYESCIWQLVKDYQTKAANFYQHLSNLKKEIYNSLQNKELQRYLLDLSNSNILDLYYQDRLRQLEKNPK